LPQTPSSWEAAVELQQFSHSAKQVHVVKARLMLPSRSAAKKLIDMRITTPL